MDEVDTEIEPDDALVELAGHLNVLNARLVALAAGVVASRAWEVGGMRTPAAYLAWKTGISPERAKTIVTIAKRRAEFPTIIARFDAGELSLEQVAEAVKAPAWADEMIAHFVGIATVSKLRRAMRSNMFDHGPTTPEPAVEPPADRVSFGVRHGRWRLHADLDIDQGRRVEAALTERRDALFTGDERDPTWPEAFVDCFERSLDAVESSSRRDRYRTWCHLDVTDGTMTTTDGWQIPPALEHQLLCDGVVQPVWERDGTPFSVGRTQRIVPDRTRRIIEHRDRGCRVPGCTTDRYVEIHHIIHWLDGGPTDTANLISLCPAHHRMHHHGRLGITGNADRFDAVVFTDTDGRVIAPRCPPVLPTGPPPAPPNPYQPPLNGRFDWNWIGLGWIHPDEQHRRRNMWRTVDRAA